MVSAAPNRTTLVGRVEAVRPHPSVARWDVLTLLVEAAERVDGYRDMIHAEPGGQLQIAVDRVAVTGVQAGATVRLAATVAGPDVVKAVPDRPTVTVISPS